MTTLAFSEKTDASLDNVCTGLARQARAASFELATVRGGLKDAWLLRVAAALEERATRLLEANERDLQAAPAFGL